MPDTQQEAEWRAEFDRIGEQQVHELVHHYPIPETKKQFAFRWLGEQAQTRRRNEAETLRTVKRTLWVAVAAVLVGILGVLVTWFHK